MDKKEVAFIALFVLVLTSSFSAFGIALEDNLVAPEDNIIASISNPRMVLYENITDNGPLEFQNSVFVNNENDFDVKITIKPSGIWEERIEVKDESFILQAGEREEVVYDITLTEPGEFGGDIVVTFEREGYGNTLAITQRLVVHVTPDESWKGSITGNVIGNSGEKVLSISAIVFTLALLITLLIFVRKKRIEKSGEKDKGKK